MTECDFCGGESEGEECDFCGAELKTSDEFWWVYFSTSSRFQSANWPDVTSEPNEKIGQDPWYEEGKPWSIGMIGRDYDLALRLKKSDLTFKRPNTVVIPVGTKIYEGRKKGLDEELNEINFPVE